MSASGAKRGHAQGGPSGWPSRSVSERPTERPTDEQTRVAQALVTYGRELESEGAAQVGVSFSGIPEADSLITRDPNAFLIGALFTQGIPAERAWAAPWLLSRRLGHFDIARIARDEDAVAEAIARPPALHRFKLTMGRWVVAAARRLVDEYDGDASRIWPVGATVPEVSERLSEFDGIGRKKSAMIVQILVRHFGVGLSGLDRGNVAYDVHVRRVFLRSGLAAEDTPEAIEQAARLACAEAPGTIDLPAWLVGRRWCRPRRPACDACLLCEICPRLTDLSVEGPGARR
jgi:uncharacterized HhH-GPD family protein